MKRMSVPQIIVLCHETQSVLDIFKALVNKYRDTRCLRYDVVVQKLMSKHIKPKEQHAILQADHKSKKRQVLNVYVGMPNRVKKLALQKSFTVGEKDT